MILKKSLEKLLLACIMCLAVFTASAQKTAPKIVNIVNFIRLLEPRDAKITQDVLYQTVVQQIESMKKHT